MKRFLVPLVVVVVVTLSVIAGLTTATTPTRSLGPTRATLCATTPRHYPDARQSDCVATNEHAVILDHTVVSATWALTDDRFGLRNVCATVSIKNLNRWGYFFNDFNMTLRPPRGRAMVLNFAASDPLGDGFIADGDIASGNICFDYTGAPGTYEGIYQPNPRRALRGIWLFHLA